MVERKIKVSTIVKPNQEVRRKQQILKCLYYVANNFLRVTQRDGESERKREMK